MDFVVFPEPQTSPIKLGYEETTENTGDDITIPTMQWENWTIHIRISSSSPIPPSVCVQALSPNGDPGSWTLPITATGSDSEPVPYFDPSDPLSTDPAGYVTVSVTPSDLAEYNAASKVLKVIIDIMKQAATWQLRIVNNDTSQVIHDFVCVVAINDLHSKQPWINVTPTALTYDVLINEIAENTVQSLTVANKGTGPLTITGTNPPLGTDFTLSVPPAPVDPNNSVDVDITFNAPSTGGTTGGTFTMVLHPDKPDNGASDAPEHNKQFVLTATTRALEVMLLLDVSGSMGWAPDGAFLPPGSSTSRWSELVSAVEAFLDLLVAFGHEHGKFGIARFPASDPMNSSTYNIVSPTNIPDQGAMGQYKTAVSGVTPTNATPMGDGLAHVLPPDPGYFSTNLTDEAVNRRWLLLMSDGANNSGTVNPTDFTPPDTTMEDNRIKLFAVGYGTQNAPSYSVDWSLLQQLAVGSYENGDTHRVHVDVISALGLAEAFRAAIKANPEITSSADPRGVLQSSAAEARHQVIITPYDTKAAFILHWNRADEKRMNLQLLTPTGDLITPESAGRDSGKSGITFSKELRYQIYSVNHDYLRNAKDPSRPRYGTWTLIVSSDKLGRGDSESYTHDVIVESRLRMDVRTDRRIHYAGDPIGLTASLTLNGRPVKNAAVTVCVTTPGHFANNWLAAATVSAKEYQKAAETLAGQDVTPLFIKAYAARIKGITFEPFTTSETVPMNDPSNQGMYETITSRTSIPGGYTFYVTAIGQTEDGIMFRRERKVEVGVSVRPDPEHTLIDIQYRRIPDRGPGVIGAEITFWPKDRRGNVVLVEPELNPSIVLTAKGGEFISPLVGNLDGSYSRSLQFSPGTLPSISVQVSGQETIGELELAPVDRLHYVDRVIGFTEGREAKKGANQHDQPKAILGSVLDKDPDEFVSLGGFGSITIGFDGEGILATGKVEDDITIFVRMDEDLRPYAVEAQPRTAKDEWVELGMSPGVTQSFSLGKARLREAAAIRITDRSGRTTDSEGNPITTPGVSIRGIGVRRVGHL